MSILTGTRIAQEVAQGSIRISDFNPKQLNPHSYNLKLDRVYKTYRNQVLYSDKEEDTRSEVIPSNGMFLYPGTIYLMQTLEWVWTNKFVPIIDGRSSVGRLGVGVHITAGFGDCGFDGHYTLEVSVVQPVMIFPFTEICQIRFQTLEGTDIENALQDYPQYQGKYQNQDGPVKSRWYREFQKEEDNV